MWLGIVLNISLDIAWYGTCAEAHRLSMVWYDMLWYMCCGMVYPCHCFLTLSLEEVVNFVSELIPSTFFWVDIWVSLIDTKLTKWYLGVISGMKGLRRNDLPLLLPPLPPLKIFSIRRRLSRPTPSQYKTFWCESYFVLPKVVLLAACLPELKMIIWEYWEMDMMDMDVMVMERIDDSKLLPH